MPILDFFDGTPRPQQREVLEILEQEFDHYDVFVLRCPVGAGKSRIATCLAGWLRSRRLSSVIATPTNILVAQYAAERPDLNTLGRKSVYRCDDCADGEQCRDCQRAWLRDMRRLKTPEPCVVNFHTYLAHKAYKNVLIADEAHTLIPLIQELAAKKLWRFQYKYPDKVRTFADLVQWLDGIPPDKRDKKQQLLYADVTSPSAAYMVYRTREWYRNVEERDVLKLVPIDTSAAPPVLWPSGKVAKVVLMSATLADKDIEMMGLAQRRVLVLDCDSPIAPAVRPVVAECRINMSYVRQDDSIPLLAERLRELIAANPHKGVIHCTYGVATKLREYLDNERLLWHNQASKKEVYEQFLASENKVLVASGLYEGVDLAFELGRWQAICKVPWPSLADPAIRRRRDLDPDWYSWAALRLVLQASGRICRDPADYGVTYVLDSTFLQLPRKLMPRWFRHALVEK